MALADTARLVATLELQDKFSKQAHDAERSLARLERQTTLVGKVGSEASRGLGAAANNLRTIGVVGIAALGALTAQSVRDASALQQAGGAVESVFGKARTALDEFAQTSAQSAGLAKREVLEMGAVIGAQLQGMGFDATRAADTVVTLEKRAADLAATFGGTTQQAIQAITALLRGERDPIEKYGVSLKQVDINAELAARGLENLEGQERKTAEATVALDLLMRQTAKTEGQFARESDSLAGVQARLAANFEDMRARLGTALLPSIAKVGERLNNLIAENQPALDAMAAKLPAIFDRLVATVGNLPWDAIASSAKLMGQGAEALLTAFTSLPPWVQTAVLTGWGLNKLTGGALGNIAGTIGKAAFGQLRGATPATPVYTKEVGLGGVPGATGGGGLLGNAGRILGGLTVIGTAGLLLTEISKFFDPNAEQRKADFRAGVTSPQSSTPTGQFAAGNLGGTGRPAPVSVTNTPDVFDERSFNQAHADARRLEERFPQLSQRIDNLRQRTVSAMKESDIHTARLAQKEMDRLHELRGTVDRRISDIIPHLGETNRALSLANRNLDDGNARQREIADRIREAREAIGTGNQKLGVIAEKDFSPNVQVDTHVNTSVSISDITRQLAITHVATDFHGGFTETF